MMVRLLYLMIVLALVPLCGMTVGTYEANDYRVITNTSLVAGAWSSVTNFPGASGTNRTVVSLPPAQHACAFYRIEIEF